MPIIKQSNDKKPNMVTKKRKYYWGKASKFFVFRCWVNQCCIAFHFCGYEFAAWKRIV